MEWLRDRKNRLTVSILAAMAAAILVAGGCIRNFAFRREAETAPERFPSGLRKCWNGDMI